MKGIAAKKLISNMMKKTMLTAAIALLCVCAVFAYPAQALAQQEDLMIKSASLSYSDGKIVGKNISLLPGVKYQYSVNGMNLGELEPGAPEIAIDISDSQIGDKYEVIIDASAEDGRRETVSLLHTVSVRDYALMHKLTDYYVVVFKGQENGFGHSFGSQPKAESGGYYFFDEEEITVSIAPNEPFVISGASVDLGNASLIPGDTAILALSFMEGVTGPSYVYTISVDVDIPDPNYDPNAPATYPIKASAGPGGRIFIEGEIQVQQGTNPAYIMLPDEGYAVENVYVDGEAKGALYLYAFWDVRAPHQIHVSFVEEDGAVSPDAVVDIPSINKTIPRTGPAFAPAGMLLMTGALLVIPRRRT
ncbi:MAG: hypothetical protein ACOX8S_08845 [Christensenellales bacterium]|jgi:hypothetical protein